MIDKRLSNKKPVALIVGAGSEAGRGIVRGLASAGLRLALNDLLPDRIEALAAEVKAAGGEAVAFPADVTRKLGLQTMLQDVLGAWERIDVLVFIASTQPPDALLDMDEWDWHRTIDMNLTAAFLCMQSAGRVMREQGGGVIVNVLAGDESASPAYAAAAGGLWALSEQAMVEFAQHGVRVHVVSDVGEVTAIIGNLDTRER